MTQFGLNTSNEAIGALYIMNGTITNGFNNIILDFFAIIAITAGVYVIVSKNPIVSVLFLILLFLGISIYLMALGINFIGLSYLLVYVGAVSILFLFILMLINVRISEILSTTRNNIPLAIAISILFFSAVYKALPKLNIYTFSLDRTPYFSRDYTLKQGYSNNLEHSELKGIANNMYYTFEYITNIFKSYLFNFRSTAGETQKTSEIEVTHFSDRFLPNNILDDVTNNAQIVSSQNWDTMIAQISHINALGNILYSSYFLWLILTSLILLLAMVGTILITLRN